jgi:hypothetical protein
LVFSEVIRVVTWRRFTFLHCKRQIVTLASSLPAGQIGAQLRRAKVCTGRT